ncbi:MAG: hypothetical protein AAF944_28345 [Bacteroidota bacterium]
MKTIITKIIAFSFAFIILTGALSSCSEDIVEPTAIEGQPKDPPS